MKFSTSVIHFAGGYYRRYEDDHGKIETIHFDSAPCGVIGNIEVHKIDNVHCLVDEYGKFIIVR